jgi:hypothetical protein
MDLIETVVWTMMGFIPTLLAMEVAWRLSRRRGKRAFVVAKDGAVRDTQTGLLQMA